MDQRATQVPLSKLATGGAAEIVGSYAGWGRVRWMATIPAKPPEMVDLPSGLPPALVGALNAMGRSQLYSHQLATIEAVREKKDVLLVTSTASGKTLAFNAAILDELLRSRSGHALYVYPLNALANDQASALRELVGNLPASDRPRIAVVTGQSDTSEKQSARGADLVLTNPESIHFSMLQRPDAWRGLLGRLRFVVVDEAHMYRGAFGAHMSHVLRRLLRISARLGSHPQLIAASATIGNPDELARLLTGREPVVIDRDGSSRPERQLVVWEPPLFANGQHGSYEREAVQLLVAALAVGRSVILFARSRRSVEGLTAEVQQEIREQLDDPVLADAVKPYRGGYTASERKEIEAGLRGGKIRAVVSTNALEVGIDIGSLDVVIIAGYPGTMQAFWQQAGRAGRRGLTSQIFYVPSANPLDEYFAESPERLLETPHEHATFDPWNPRIAVQHVLWRAGEVPIRSSGPWEDPAAERITSRLVEEGALESDGTAYRPVEPLDYEVSLRSIEGRPFRVLDRLGRHVGDVDEQYLYRECHPGAVYAHQGRAYRVERLDEVARQVYVVGPSDWTTTTKAVVTFNVTLVEELARRQIGPARLIWDVRLARLTTSESYDAYQESERRPPRRLVDEGPINPALVRERPTVGIVIHLPAGVSAEGAHAVEHAIHALVPTEVMCDRRDFVSLTRATTVYLYDRNVEGLGFAERAYQQLPAIIAAAAERLNGCRCDFGCPLCVQSATCERMNDELAKDEARMLLAGTMGMPTAPSENRSPTVDKRSSSARQITGSVAAAMVEEDRRRAGDALAENISGSGKWPSDEGWEASRYRSGGRVYHEAWGMGRIDHVRSHDYGLLVEVLFDSVGRKVVLGRAGNLRIPRPDRR